MKTIVIAKEYSDTSGGRLKKEGPFSGEDFRETILIPLFEDKKNENEEVLVDFDGGYGYPVSFLEEAFGGIAYAYGSKVVLAKIKFKSDEEPGLIGEVRGYILQYTRPERG